MQKQRVFYSGIIEKKNEKKVEKDEIKFGVKEVG